MPSQVNDLFDARKKDLKVHYEGPESKRGTWVQGLTERTIASMDEMMKLMAVGEGNRHVDSTGLNDVSSRSHSIFFIEVTP